MNLLALDTATEACSAALQVGDSRLQRFEVAPRRHGELILPMIESLLAEAGLRPAQLDALAFGRGPGAFTGVRIGASVAQGLALALDLPVLPISTLAAIAQGAARESTARRVLAAIDARMGEVYTGAFVADPAAIMAAVDREQVQPPAAWRPPAGEWLGAGSGWQSYPAELAALPGVRLLGREPGRLPQALDLLSLAVPALAAGGGLDPAEALPVYLRDQVAKPAGER